MRHKRSKAYRKLMSMFSTSFGFRQPYQVLVDSTMCETAVSSKMDLAAQMESVLVGSVKLMITQCCIHELYLQGKSHQPAVDLAKSFERRKCNHKEAIPGDECIAAVVGDSNKHRYVIATQSHPLRVNLRAVPGVPIVHVNRAVMVLEPASDATLRAKHRVEQDALVPSTSERAILNAATPQVEHVPKKKSGPKGPNPLSVKKKARKHILRREEKGSRMNQTATDEESSSRPKRRRRRKSHSRPQGENV
ncbi:Fcf1-domain-containing protein [Lactarius deliciosus]|nr:Fcf1-domain-containing protein [Lactarius deliciosus]